MEFHNEVSNLFYYLHFHETFGIFDNTTFITGTLSLYPESLTGRLERPF